MITISEIKASRVGSYLALFKDCFPQQKLSNDFLNWLYFQNPEGGVIGFDALVHERVIGHYACIPTNIGGVKGLLSLNSAVAREFRGQGIFEKLANLTYNRGKHEFRFVVGVANANSEKLFLNKLDFTKLGNLNLRFGSLFRPSEGARIWSKESIDWIASNPRSRITVNEIDQNVFEATIRWSRYGLPLKVLLSTKAINPVKLPKCRYGFTVDWSVGKNPLLSLPKLLKPAPLSLIIKTFDSERIDVNSWTCLDFDLI